MKSVRQHCAINFGSNRSEVFQTDQMHNHTTIITQGRIDLPLPSRRMERQRLLVHHAHLKGNRGRLEDSGMSMSLIMHNHDSSRPPFGHVREGEREARSREPLTSTKPEQQASHWISLICGRSSGQREASKAWRRRRVQRRRLGKRFGVVEAAA
jgi:hypothetical protein